MSCVHLLCPRPIIKTLRASAEPRPSSWRLSREMEGSICGDCAADSVIVPGRLPVPAVAASIPPAGAQTAEPGESGPRREDITLGRRLGLASAELRNDTGLLPFMNCPDLDGCATDPVPDQNIIRRRPAVRQQPIQKTLRFSFSGRAALPGTSEAGFPSCRQAHKALRSPRRAGRGRRHGSACRTAQDAATWLCAKEGRRRRAAVRE